MYTLMKLGDLTKKVKDSLSIYHCSDGKVRIAFRCCDIMKDKDIISVLGSGTTLLEAEQDLCNKISHNTLVRNVNSNSPQYFTVGRIIP